MATLTAKQLPPDEQPRERALKYGIGALATSELWAILLRVGIRGVTILDLCRSLMNAAGGTLHGLDRLDFEALQELPGLGPDKALQVMAAMELSRRYNKEAVSDTASLTSSVKIYEEIRYDLEHLDHEEIWVIFLNQRLAKVSKQRITSGSDVASIFDVAAIMRRALYTKARAMVLCHNHPSGNLRPSPQDDQITRKLMEAAKLMDMRLIDHLIITAGGYFSYNDEGRAPF